VGWFQVSKGRLEYRGRITRDPFTRWAGTREGAEAIAQVAGGIRFSLIGRTRSARRRVWQTLDSAARVESLVTALGAEAKHYMAALASLSYSAALPRANVALHRLVLVPRAMIAARSRAALHGRLGKAAQISELDEAVRMFFLDELPTEMDAALTRASPSPSRPVQAHDEWACIGVEQGLVWVDPLWAGSAAAGHVFMYEFPRAGLSRRERKAVEAAIAEITARVSTLSRADRGELVRAAQ
jgi:hypothetical protein